MPVSDQRAVEELDPQALTFLIGVCLSEEDVTRLLAVDTVPPCCRFAVGVSRHNRIHAGCRAGGALARRVTDLLDLRHADLVWEVRTASADAVRARVAEIVREQRVDLYPGALWALLSDGRAVVQVFGGSLVFECFRLGCEAVRRGATPA